MRSGPQSLITKSEAYIAEATNDADNLSEADTAEEKAYSCSQSHTGRKTKVGLVNVLEATKADTRHRVQCSRLSVTAAVPRHPSFQRASNDKTHSTEASTCAAGYLTLTVPSA